MSTLRVPARRIPDELGRALVQPGREVQRGGAVVRPGPGTGREPQVEHEPDCLGVAVVGGVGQDPVILGGEPGLDGVPAVRISIRKQPEANTVEVADNATMALALGGYAGFHTATPPTAATAFGVYWPAVIPATVVTQQVHLPDGETQAVRHTSDLSHAAAKAIDGFCEARMKTCLVVDDSEVVRNAGVAQGESIVGLPNQMAIVPPGP